MPQGIRRLLFGWTTCALAGLPDGELVIPRTENVSPHVYPFRLIMTNHNMNADTATMAMAALFAIAHKSRLAILQVLVAAGPGGLSAGDISDQLKIAPSSLSFHLKEMSRACLISPRREGTSIYYSAVAETMGEVIDFLVKNCLLGWREFPA